MNVLELDAPDPAPDCANMPPLQMTSTVVGQPPLQLSALERLVYELKERINLLHFSLTTPPAPEPLVYDTADMCQILRVSLATLHRFIAAGKLPRARKLGGQLRWDVSEIRAWVSAGMPELNRWEAIQKANGRRS